MNWKTPPLQAPAAGAATHQPIAQGRSSLPKTPYTFPFHAFPLMPNLADNQKLQKNKKKQKNRERGKQELIYFC